MKISTLNIIQAICIIILAIIVIMQRTSTKENEVLNTTDYKPSITCVYKKIYASTVNYILRDDNTGVCYIAMSNGAITPMVDANGNIIVDKNFIKSDVK